MEAAAIRGDDHIPEVKKRLNRIFEKGRGEFFVTVNRLLEKHFRRDELSAADLERLGEAEKGIPGLFERISNIAYQKDAPIYEHLIADGGSEAMDHFERMFSELSRDYAGRFVGSLFRRSKHADFARLLPHIRGKSTLDLVLQTLGYEVNHTLPDVPENRRFANPVEDDIHTQWAIDAVNAREGWKTSRGEDVVVAVLDSGIDPFNAFFEDRVTGGFSFLRRTTPPWSGENPPTIDYGLHGTGVSSALLAIAPECRVMMIRTGDSDTMNDPPFPYWLYELGAAGIYRAVHDGAHIISKSSILMSTEPVTMAAVRYACEKNVPICSSAGNTPRAHLGLRPQDAVYPAFDQEVLLIGGVEKTSRGIRPWPSTVPNLFMDVAAPSKDVFVLVPIYLKELKNQWVAGTSLSAPIAAGVAAMMRGAVPPGPEILAEPGEYVRMITRALRETAHLRELGMQEPNQAAGYGLIDAEAAIRRMRELMTEWRERPGRNDGTESKRGEFHVR